ncbi:MAG: OmpA family protein [Alphaproteobacteria bacterium]|nr:OmpA family protein [Alphaproteobacteria bacterium]
MRLQRTLLAGAAAIALTSHANASELRGTYAAIEGGAGWVGSERFSQITATGGVIGASATYDADFDTGWAIFGSLGYAFGNNMRAELELGYRQNEIESLREIFPVPGALAPDGDLSEFTVMANLLYDIPLGRHLTLTVGAGVGADQANLDAGVLGFDDGEWVFAYQGIAGLSYAIGDQTQIFVNYRYLHADAPEYTTGIAANTVQHTAFLGDLGKHTATLGLRFAFEGVRTRPEMAPPAPPPAPPPPPPAAAPPQFIVFFGLDSAELVPEAQRVVNDAAGAAKEFGAAAIHVVAHTDSSGSTAYNQRLSERRAGAIRAALATNGIPANAITTEGRGEGDLMVRTGDGIKEPQNRRATIDMK